MESLWPLVKANQISEWRCIGLTAKEERVEEETKYPHERMSCRMCLTGSQGPPTETAREKREREREGAITVEWSISPGGAWNGWPGQAGLLNR